MDQIWAPTTLCDEFKPKRRPRSVVIEVQAEGKKHITCSATVKGLIVALALMFVCCLILLNLYLTQRAKKAKEIIVEKPWNSTSEKPTHGLFYGGSCWSTDCLHAASDLLDSIEPSVNPCEDFYRYACGGWMKKHPKPSGAITWNQFEKLTMENNKLIEMLLKDKEIKAFYSREEAVWKAMAYYDSCMDVEEIEQLKGEPLKRLIKRFGSWSITDEDWKEENWELLEHIVQVHKYLALPILFTMSVKIDNKNSSQTVITFSKANTVLAPRELLTNDTESQRVREAYLGLMVNMTRKLGATKASETDIIKTFEFEKELAKIAPPRSPRLLFQEDYKKMTLRQLEEYTGHLFNWTTYVKMMMTETLFHVQEQVEIIVYNADYLKRLAKLISITPKRTIANYLMWRVTKAKFLLLSRDFIDIFKNYYLQAFNYWRDSDKNELCLLATMQNFGTPLSKVFLDQKFYGDSKKLAIDIIEDIRSAFISNLKREEWMDEETKLAAEEKAEALIENIGYPDYLMDVDYMSNMFKEVEIHPKRYFENDISATRHSNLNELRKAGILVDKSDWPFPPTMLNAFYSYNENKIVFPAAILQPPFYNMRYPRAINYGAIGGIMAHEITHGFDDNGKMFDSQGNQRKWWSNSTLKNFHEKSSCLVNQYSNFTFFGYQVNGKMTLSENIADNGGVRVALEAYRKWVSDHWEEPRLPGMMLTNEQVFFVSFARNWCSNYNKAGARFASNFYDHSPMPWRVNGTLMNFPEFAKTFNCPIGSPMNPEKKCKIW